MKKLLSHFLLFIVGGFVTGLALLTLFFMNYPLGDWLPFAKDLLPNLYMYTPIQLFFGFQYFWIAGVIVFAGIYIIKGIVD